MKSNVHSLEMARGNLVQLLADAEHNGPQIIEDGKKRFEISYIGEKHNQLAKDFLAKGGPLIAEDN